MVKRTLRPGPDKLCANIHANIRRGVQQVVPHAPQATQIALCAGGPTLVDHIEDIRRLQIEGAEVVCVGNAAATLNAHGVKVNGHVLLDGAGRNKAFVIPDRDARYFIASQCDPAVLDALEGHAHVYLWHAVNGMEEEAILTAHYGRGGWYQVAGGSFVSLRAISLMGILGYTWLNIFGLDSCILKDSHHAYSQPNADGQKTADVKMAGKTFTSTAWMLDQADQFVKSVENGRFGSLQLAIHGDGLIATMIRTGGRPTWQLQ